MSLLYRSQRSTPTPILILDAPPGYHVLLPSLLANARRDRNVVPNQSYRLNIRCPRRSRCRHLFHSRRGFPQSLLDPFS